MDTKKVRAEARRICKKYPQECMRCGFNGAVEIAHIKPLSSFDDDEIERANYLSNLSILCPNCHTMFDRHQAFVPESVGHRYDRAKSSLQPF